jgi:hypothetical protein
MSKKTCENRNTSTTPVKLIVTIRGDGELGMQARMHGSHTHRSLIHYFLLSLPVLDISSESRHPILYQQERSQTANRAFRYGS